MIIDVTFKKETCYAIRFESYLRFLSFSFIFTAYLYFFDVSMEIVTERKNSDYLKKSPLMGL